MMPAQQTEFKRTPRWLVWLVDRVAIRRAPQWPVWLIGAAFVSVLAFRDVLLTEHGIVAHEVYWGRDFINVWTGGHLVREGRLGLLYDLKGYAAYQRTLFGPIGWHNYSYPPSSYPLAALFSLLPYWLALASWTLGTGALFALACRRWWPKAAGPVWLALLTPAAVVNIWAGHYGFLMGALFLFGWQWLEGHPRRAGVAFGLMLIKPHLAILVPLVLLIRRDWTALVSGALTVLAIFAGTIWWFGWQPWSEFLFGTTEVQARMINAGSLFYRFLSPSVAMAAMQAGASWTVALIAQAIAAVGAVALAATAAWRRMPVWQLAFLTATCTFVLLPYGFNYDMTVVCVGALALMNSAHVRSDDYRLGVYGFLAPQLGMVTGAYLIFLMPVMTCGLAIAQFRSWGWRQWYREKSSGTPFNVSTAFAR